jgi:hypothetical protein
MNFYSTQVSPMIQIKIQVLNLKTLKTQILIKYLTLFIISSPRSPSFQYQT